MPEYLNRNNNKNYNLESARYTSSVDKLNKNHLRKEETTKEILKKSLSPVLK